MRPRALRALCLPVCLLLFVRCGLAQELRPLEIPPEYQEAQTLSRQVQNSKLSNDAKAVVAEHFAAVDAQFTRLWRPLKEKYDNVRTVIRENHLEYLRLENEKKNVASQRPPSSATPAQAAAYNALVDQFNARVNESNDRRQRRLDEAEKSLTEIGTKFDAWLEGRPLREFKTVAQALLDGRVKFHKGLAWRQLVSAAEGAGGQVFENQGPDAVDATGVRPYAPGERERELQKPRVQPPRRTPSPPPPSPSPSPGTAN